MAISPNAKEPGVAGEGSQAGTLSSCLPARTRHEEAIAAIWREVLDRPDVGVLDDFFDLDGDSLRAIQMIGRVRKLCGVNIRAMDFFESPTVAALAAAVATPSGQPVISRRPAGAHPVPSLDQQRLWLENQLWPGTAYNIHVRRRLVGRLKVSALNLSIRAIVSRHEALRTRFPTVDGRPVQIVDDIDENWQFSLVDLSESTDGLGAARQLADNEAATRFDLARGPLFRCLLIRLSDTEHVLSVTAHHIVCDDWSAGLFVRELTSLYRVDGDVGRANLPDLPVQYRDYAVWQQQWLTGETLQWHVDYWRDHLSGAPPVLALPASAWRATDRGTRGGHAECTLTTEETAALRKLCHAHRVTLFTALLAALATVLCRWSGQQDVVIGVPIAGRSDGGTESLIGFFVNTLPVRVDLSGEPTFTDLLGRVRQAALGAYSHADAPLDVLVQELRASRVPGRTPLFQVILNGVDSAPPETLTGVSAEPMDTPAQPSKFDLAVTAREVDGEICLQLDFDAERYQEGMIADLLGHVAAVVRSATGNPDLIIFDYALQVGREDIASVDAQASAELPAPHRALERFAQLPDRIAIQDADGTWSYRRLNRAADRVARALAERNRRPADQPVGIVSSPTAGFVAGLLGCMKAGVRFSVIGTATNSGASAVLDWSCAGELPDPIFDSRAILPDDSGQTPSGQDPVTPSVGSPADWAAERYGLTGTDRFAVLSGQLNHLISGLSTALSVGASLLLPDPWLVAEPDALLNWLADNSITVAYLSLPVLRALAARAAKRQWPTLRYAFVENDGETICHDIDALRRISATCRCVTLHQVDSAGRPLAAYELPEEWRSEAAPLRIPLGTELPGASAELLNAAGHRAAPWEIGDIWAAGRRTGIRGRRRSDGTLEFFARQNVDAADDPIQIVGSLRDIPGVADALVTELQGDDGGGILAGYVAAPCAAPDPVDIRQQLVGQLPGHLVPQHLFVLEQFPLTSECSYDLAAFPLPGADSAALDSYVPPGTPVERQLADLLGELLDSDHIGIYDSFFELGGFSLLASQLSSRIQELFRVEIALRDIFASATIDALAQLIVRARAGQADAAEVEALLDEIDGLPDGHC